MTAFAFALFLFGQTLDTTTTVAALKQPRLAEGNRFIPSGPTGIVLTKATVMTGIGIAAWKLGRHHPKARIVTFALVGGIGAVAGFHNIHMIRGKDTGHE